MSEIIFNAIKDGNIDLVQKFIKQKNNIYTVNSKQYNLAQMAIINNQLDILKLLLDSGLSPNTVDIRNKSLLSTAAAHNKYLHALELVNEKANIHSRDNNGNTALHFSSSYETTLIFELLMNNGANIEEQNQDGATSLHLVCQNVSEEMKSHIDKHIQFGANINSLDYFHCSPLHYASLYNNFHIVKYLLQYNCDTTLKDIKGETALDLAIHFNYHETIGLLNAFNLYSSLEENITKSSNTFKNKLLKL